MSSSKIGASLLVRMGLRTGEPLGGGRGYARVKVLAVE
jgi:hypothetical protein